MLQALLEPKTVAIRSWLLSHYGTQIQEIVHKLLHDIRRETIALNVAEILEHSWVLQEHFYTREILHELSRIATDEDNIPAEATLKILTKFLARAFEKESPSSSFNPPGFDETTPLLPLDYAGSLFSTLNII